MVKEVHYNEYGGIDVWREYDNQARMVKEVNYNLDGSIYDGYECEYDRQGNMIKEVYYNDGDSVYYEDEYDS